MLKYTILTIAIDCYNMYLSREMSLITEWRKYMRVRYEEMIDEFKKILIKKGFSESDALDAGTIFAQNSLDGVYSHGVNRFPRVISYIEKGGIDPKAKPVCEGKIGAFEKWNGNLGLGNLNAKKAMDRACELSNEFGIGIVAMANTNHWMRGGHYGWQAADKGCIGICWTNTMPNMPAWGSKERNIGNNPFIMSIPKSDGKHVVIDCAVAQFSYGKIEESRLKGVQLPVVGGYDTKGNVTTDPKEIEKTWRVLPIGFWKGSGISIALDLIASVLSGGNSVTDIGRKYKDEIGLSQVMIAINPNHMSTKESTDYIINNVIEDIKSSEPATEGGEIYYPGELEVKTRNENLANGIPVLNEIWETILKL
ncbi:3-dehydro-L-gulonate 2-dehydrogenase [Natranaerovirga hydrolytica]|uniref:3-dehydro-L-gulonate 2-dehydrogenase n=2 Tax=Natranaerovirga hydrolytica TaxID=680378 RepID=A0A4R1MS19_9FIRM|nr:3-dehydro-L-gulonate 2-dehydrogenase [Natranaerovirga hydrolytica]